MLYQLNRTKSLLSCWVSWTASLPCVSLVNHFFKKLSLQFDTSFRVIFSVINTVTCAQVCENLNLSKLDCHQTSNIICTQSQNLNLPHLVLQLSLLNPLKPGVQLRMKMWKHTKVYGSMVNTFAWPFPFGHSCAHVHAPKSKYFKLVKILATFQITIWHDHD